MREFMHYLGTIDQYQISTLYTDSQQSISIIVLLYSVEAIIILSVTMLETKLHVLG